MSFTWITSLATAGLFGGMLALTEIGRRIGAGRIARNPDGLAKGVSAVEGAVFGLLGLIVAFTFAGAASRFEGRRHLVTDEANAIGTAYLRVDLLPADAQPEIRDLFRRYVDSRLAAYRNPEDTAATRTTLAENASLQGEIWTKAIAACRRPDAPPQAAMLLVPALNEMIDIMTTRLMATRNHPPPVIFALLVGLSLMGAILVGYGMSANEDRSWLHTASYSLVMAIAIYVIVDLEFPRLGLIRVDAADQVLVEVRRSMG